MRDPFSATLIGATLLLAVVTGVLSWLRRPTPRPVTTAVLVVSAAVVVQAILALVLMAGAEEAAEPGTFVGYALASVVVLPAAVAWARAEPGRWGNGVLAIGCLTMAVVVVRMDQLWGVGGG